MATPPLLWPASGLTVRRSHHPVCPTSPPPQESVPTHLTGDAKRIVQVLCNLLVNSARYTPEGGTITLRVAARELSADDRDSAAEGGGGDAEHKVALLVVSVQDTGMGLSPDNIDRVFEPWVQEEKAKTMNYGGCGLGLAVCRLSAPCTQAPRRRHTPHAGPCPVADHPGSPNRVLLSPAQICKRLASAMHGTITAQSAGVGLGTTVTLKLPLQARAHTRADTQQDGSFTLLRTRRRRRPALTASLPGLPRCPRTWRRRACP